MIYSIGIDLNYKHEKINIKYNLADTQKSGTKEVNRFATIAQLERMENSNNPIIIIPANLNCMYNIRDLLDHIRLSFNEKIRMAPVFIRYENDNNNFLNKIDYHIKYSVEPLGNNEYPDLSEIRKLKLNEWNNLIKLIGNEPRKKLFTGTHHNLSNHWGAYRLLKAYIELDNELENQHILKQIEQQLAGEIYFKKKILLDKLRNNHNQNIKKPKDYFNLFYNYVKKYEGFKLLIIEDQLNFPQSEIGWEQVYNELFKHSEINITIDYIATKEDAKKVNPQEYNLVLLDLRLSEEPSYSSEDIQNIQNFSGIQILKKLKSQDPSIPIIFTTASNKSWSIKSAYDFGADGYWIKESPKLNADINYSIMNLNDLISQITQVITPESEKIRALIKKSLNIPTFIKDKFDNYSIENSVEQKCNSFIGLIHKSYSEFIENLTDSSRLHLAFLEIFGIMNDILSLLVFKEGQRYYIDINNSKEEVNQHDHGGFYNEKNAIKRILRKLDIDKYSQFKKLYNIRNKLNIIHGRKYVKDNLSESQASNPGLEEITELLNIYYEILDRIEMNKN